MDGGGCAGYLVRVGARIKEFGRARHRTRLSRDARGKLRGSGGEPLCKPLALKVGSRRLPGITQRVAAPSTAFGSRVAEWSSWAVTYVGTFPGAACCEQTELQTYKAAPLQCSALARGSKADSAPRVAPPILPIFLPLKPHHRIMGELHLINERVKVEKKP